MTWSYSGDPATSDLDETRFYIQDTIEERQLLQDEEIQFLLDKWLDQFGSVIFVAASACEVIAAKFAAEVNVSADGVSVSTGDLQDRYMKLAEQLREQAHQELDSGVSEGLADLWSTAWDNDIEALLFGIGFMDNYEAGRADYGAYKAGNDPDIHKEQAPKTAVSSKEPPS